jgi:hypothetical protein
MQKIIIGIVFAAAAIIISLATLPLGIAAPSYAQKTTTNLDKNSIKGSLTSIQNDASTMKDGPVKDVPTSITFIDESAVSIWLDPSKTNNHFGNTAIYGNQHLICVELPNYCK